MSLILARSPYFVSREDLDNDATLKLEIGDTIDGGDFEIEKTYNLAFRNAYLIDVSPLIRDYLGNSFSWGTNDYVRRDDERTKYTRITLSGSKNGVAQSDTVTESYISEGYLYSTDDYNKDFSSEIQAKAYYAGSSDVIYKLDDSTIRIPLINTVNDLISGVYDLSEKVTAIFYNKGVQVGEQSIFLDNEFSYGGYSYIHSNGEGSMYADNGYKSYRDRVETDNGTYEVSKCLDKFIRCLKIEEFDRILLLNSSDDVFEITVKTVEENKHNPYRVTFLNRYGIEEDLWFFKRSDTSISINKESFRGNSIGRYNSGNGVKTMNHFNINGRDKIMLNSGFVDERMNESFRQLLLSEEVRLYNYTENKTYNVNLGTSELQYKTHINDKLINYSIEFEFAHEVINNVG